MKKRFCVYVACGHHVVACRFRKLDPRVSMVLSFPKILSGLDSRRETESSHHWGLYKGCFSEHTYCPHSTRGTMAPFKPKPRQPPMTKAELRAQGIKALAQVTTPIMKLPMKIRRQCGHCGDFNSVLVEPGQAVPAFKCSACGYPAG